MMYEVEVLLSAWSLEERQVVYMCDVTNLHDVTTELKRLYKYSIWKVRI